MVDDIAVKVREDRLERRGKAAPRLSGSPAAAACDGPEDREAIVQRLIDEDMAGFGLDSAAIRKKLSALKPADVLSSELLAAFTAAEIHKMIISKRVLERRVANGEPLSQQEIDRAFRLARFWQYALKVFRDPAKVKRWMRDANPEFGRSTPLSLLATVGGARVVEKLLGRIDHGIFV